MSLFSRFLKDESGATAIEYGLIAAIVSLAIIAGLNIVGPELGETFNTIGTTLQNAQTP
jgi:pilus assembly protein Flp/PilA